ncbi:hypothetical protein G9C98_002393 [Cotesia typhae]|uniref:U3 small nucleolar RNA-associated protein 6 homolog n=1 Tax=Cotesia typhae TaxID=2053667 RepID=A0A8J5QSU3_9HYME|nr:hypothetical protein G9C98_002393 [Cotesia typhae]
MADLIENQFEDIDELEYINKMKLFDKSEIRNIVKQLEEYESKIQSNTKCKEDYLKYITYEMDLLKRVKQRKEKLGITQQSDTESPIIKKVNSLYQKATIKFQDDLRFWMAYMKFRKQLRLTNNICRLIEKMIEIHKNKQECWIIAARWQIEENKNLQKGKHYLLKGLRLHPTSQDLYSEIFQLILNETETTDELAVVLERAQIVYQQAFKQIKDVTFIIKLLEITTNHKKTEKLQELIIGDLLKDYSYKPQVWDTMARRELAGFTYDPDGEDDHSMEVDETELNIMRRRINFCNQGTKILGNKALPLWNIKLLYTQAKYPNKVEEIYLAGMIEAVEISREIKPAYIKWVVLTKGIQIARHIYNELSVKIPFCLELHKEMIEIELIQPDICKQNARRPHEMATSQFGKTNTEVWINFIEFEMKYGEPHKVSDIHRRAVKTLEATYSDSFISAFNIIQTSIN